MTTNYMFILLVTMMAAEPTPVIISMVIYPTETACTTAGTQKVASLSSTTPAQKYVFNCIKAQVES